MRAEIRPRTKTHRASHPAKRVSASKKARKILT
jgi:hypothetical protein